MTKILQVTIPNHHMAAFKTIIKIIAMKISKSNIICRPKVNDTNAHLRIFAINTDKTLMLNLRLEISEFSKFICDSEILLGIHWPTLNKIINIMNNDEWLSLIVDDEDKSKLKIKIHNTDKQRKIILSLNLLSLPNEFITIPAIKATSIIISTKVFHKICEKFKKEDRDIEFICNNEILKLSAIDNNVNNNVNTSIELKHDIDIILHDVDAGQIKQIYKFNNLYDFDRLINLSDSINIFMKQNYPLIIKFHITTLGYMYICVPHCIEYDILKYLQNND